LCLRLKLLLTLGLREHLGLELLGLLHLERLRRSVISGWT
jgi:hypothetical protein